ncbi:MAG: FAD-dependent monooxygenase, partial [Bacteroidia bacterium]
RVLGTLPAEFADKEDVGFSDIENVIIKTVGIPLHFEKVNWFSVYKLHHRCVDNFRKGRIFLAGDSAHIHSPAGGQGMNTGLQDASNLAWKIAFVLRGYAQPELLETYNEERLPFAQWLMKFTDRAFGIMTSENWFIAWFRKNIVLNLIGKVLTVTSLRPRIFKTVSQIGYSYATKALSFSDSHQPLLFKAGDRFPYLQTSNGMSFYNLFNEPCFHLLRISAQKTEITQDEKIKALFPFPVKEIHAELTDDWKKLGVTGELHILVRPDNYIAMISDQLTEKVIRKYLDVFFRENNSFLRK